MQARPIIILILAFVALAWSRGWKSSGPNWWRHLKGWQKIFGLVAVLLAILILLNPETLVLGLLGDTAFFDVLVLALSVQMVVLVQWGWRRLRTVSVNIIRWTGIPSPGLRMLLIVSALLLTRSVSLAQKIAHKFL